MSSFLKMESFIMVINNLGNSPTFSPFNNKIAEKTSATIQPSFRSLYFSGHENYKLVHSIPWAANIKDYLALWRSKAVETWTEFVRKKLHREKIIIGAETLQTFTTRQAINDNFNQRFKKGKLDKSLIELMLKLKRSSIQLILETDSAGKNMVHKACELGNLDFFNALYASTINRRQDWQKAIHMSDTNGKIPLYYATLMLLDKCSEMTPADFKKQLDGFLKPLVDNNVYRSQPELKAKYREIIENSSEKLKDENFSRNLGMLSEMIEKATNIDRMRDLGEVRYASSIKNQEQLINYISKAIESSKTDFKEYLSLTKEYHVELVRLLTKKGVENLLADPEKLSIFLGEAKKQNVLDRVFAHRVEGHSLLDYVVLKASEQTANVNEELIDTILSLQQGLDYSDDTSLIVAMTRLQQQAIALASEKKNVPLLTYLSRWQIGKKKPEESLSVLQEKFVSFK